MAISIFHVIKYNSLLFIEERNVNINHHLLLIVKKSYESNFEMTKMFTCLEHDKVAFNFSCMIDTSDITLSIKGSK